MANSLHPSLAVEAHDLVKVFPRGNVRALDGVSLQVEAGTVLGLLGPNGAGKTTVVRILSTILGPDSGHASVLGLDVVTQADAVRRTIGLAGQYAAVDENLTGRENIHMVARLSHLSRKVAARRANELLEEFGLSHAGGPRAQDLLGRHAPAAGPGRRAGGEPTRPLPRRADDRPGPPEPPGAVGRHRRTGQRGHDGPADDPVPRGGRPAGPRHRGDRPRACHRRRDPGTAQGRPGDLGGLGDAWASAPRWTGRCDSSRPCRRSRRSSRTS